jgi:hypothetical protein
MLMEEKEKPWSSLLPRYFIHGLLFELIFFLLGLAWVFLLAVLLVIGAIIGLIIGIIVLFFILGGINTVLMGEIWQFRVKDDWKSLLIHGIALFIVLLITSIPSFIVSLSNPDLIVQIVVFIVYCFVDGIIAKAVGSIWEGEGENGEE